MKNKINIIFISILIPLCSLAQVGINNNNPQAELDIITFSNTPQSKALRVSNSTNVDDFTLTSQGRLGINKPNPIGLVHVVGTTDNDGGIILEQSSDNNTSAPVLTLRRNRSADIYTNVALQDNNYIAAIAFSGNTGDGYTGDPLNTVPSFGARAEQNFTPTAKGAELLFSVTPANSTTSPVRLYISHNGLVGMDRSPTTNILEVNGQVSKDAAGNWLANSDARLKKDIQSIEGQEALNKLVKLEGISYYWNDNREGYDRPKEKQIGFTAQNIQEVFPEKVEVDNEGYLQTAYGEYDPIFVESIKALNDKVLNLLASLEKLEQENAFLKNKVKK